MRKLGASRTTKRLASKQLRARERRKATAMSSENIAVAARGSGIRALFDTRIYSNVLNISFSEWHVPGAVHDAVCSVTGRTVPVAFNARTVHSRVRAEAVARKSFS